MTGQPIAFCCWRCRKSRECRSPLGCGHRQRRTGRTKPSKSRRGYGMLDTEHEYVCECGHRGWSWHNGVLAIPEAS